MQLEAKMRRDGGQSLKDDVLKQENQEAWTRTEQRAGGFQRRGRLHSRTSRKNWTRRASAENRGTNNCGGIARCRVPRQSGPEARTARAAATGKKKKDCPMSASTPNHDGLLNSRQNAKAISAMSGDRSASPRRNLGPKTSNWLEER